MFEKNGKYIDAKIYVKGADHKLSDSPYKGLVQCVASLLQPICCTETGTATAVRRAKNALQAEYGTDFTELSDETYYQTHLNEGGALCIRCVMEGVFEVTNGTDTVVIEISEGEHY